MDREMWGRIDALKAMVVLALSGNGPRLA